MNSAQIFEQELCKAKEGVDRSQECVKILKRHQGSPEYRIALETLNVRLRRLHDLELQSPARVSPVQEQAASDAPKQAGTPSYSEMSARRDAFRRQELIEVTPRHSLTPEAHRRAAAAAAAAAGVPHAGP